MSESIVCTSLAELFEVQDAPEITILDDQVSMSGVADKNCDRGVLITFEGGDGSGKSTHIKFLAALLEDLGCDVIRLREPGGTNLGEMLRELVLDGSIGEVSNRAELLIYEAARAQLIDDIIAPALAEGKVVLCDRFTDSSVAYQGYGRGIDIDEVKHMNRFAASGIVPDLTIVLNCTDRKEKRDRVDRRDDKDRLELAGDDFHSRVIEAFKTMAQEESKRVKLVDTQGSHSQTARAIFDVLGDVLPVLISSALDFDDVLKAYDAAHDHSDNTDRECICAADLNRVDDEVKAND